MAVVAPKLVKIPVAHPMTLYTVSGRPVKFVVCDKALAKPLTTALVCLSRLGKPVTLVYHGCHNPRNIAGTDKLSQHYYGRAIDLNAHIGVPPRMLKCFEEAGFTNGGQWPAPKTDPMHFEIPINSKGDSYE